MRLRRSSAGPPNPARHANGRADSARRSRQLLPRATRRTARRARLPEASLIRWLGPGPHLEELPHSRPVTRPLELHATGEGPIRRPEGLRLPAYRGLPLPVIPVDGPRPLTSVPAGERRCRRAPFFPPTLQLSATVRPAARLPTPAV